MTWNGPFLVGVDVVWMPLMGCAPQCICLKHADILVCCIRFYIPTPSFLPNLLFLFLCFAQHMLCKSMEVIVACPRAGSCGFPICIILSRMNTLWCCGLCVRRTLQQEMLWTDHPDIPATLWEHGESWKKKVLPSSPHEKLLLSLFGILGSCQYRQLMCFALV